MLRNIPPRLRAILATLLAGVVLVSTLSPVLAGIQPAFFGYSRVSLPLISKPAAQPPAAPNPNIVVWLDIPSQVRINDQLMVVVTIQNRGNTDFSGHTTVTIPYDGRKFFARSTSFDPAQGDWVKLNKFPGDLVVEFGPIHRFEYRRGIIFYSLRDNGSQAAVGDRLRVRGRFSNGQTHCGSTECQMNERFVEVVNQSASPDIGSRPPGDRHVEKLGDISYGEQRRWIPMGFLPDEEVVTWLNIAGGGTRPLPLNQHADSSGRVIFSIDVSDLRDGFYSIVAHGKLTKFEVVGEFRVIGSPVITTATTNRVLIPLPVSAEPASAAGSDIERARVSEQATGDSLLQGVVAVAGTNGATRLAGVQVNVVAADGTVVGAEATDTFGGYLISSLAPGTYTVTFNPQSSFDETVRRYQPKTVAGVVVAADARAQLDAEVAAGASVSGLVTGAGSGGLTGVSVSLLSGATVVASTTTGDDGSYLLEGVPSGSYTLRFVPNASADQGVRAFNEATLAAFSVAAPTPVSGQDIVLTRSTSTVTIDGQVVAADSGTPLAGVFAIFERLNATTSTFEYAGLALTDIDGQYSAELPPGRYRVAFRPGFSTDAATSRYIGEYFDNITNGSVGAAELDLAGGASARADAALAPGGTISGNVRSATAPLADVAVLVSDANDVLVDVEVTDADGNYRTDGLPAGSYRLEYATYFAADPATRRYAGVKRATPVAITSTAGITGINATLNLGGQIAGSVSGTAGVPLPGALVLVVDTHGTPAATDDTLGALAVTDATGAYTTSALPTGAYLVEFVTELSSVSDVLSYFDEFYNNAATLAEADLVSVTAGATTANINALLRQGGQIKGRVTSDVDGIGLDGVLVEIYDAANPTVLVAFGITDESGNYATTVLTTGASYRVRFNPSFGGGAALYAPETYNNGTITAVSVPSTTPVTGINAGLALLP